MSGRPIAFILPDMRIGGAERVALTLIQAFAAAGERVDLVLQQAEGELLTELPASVRVVNLKAARLRSAIRPLARYFREAKPRAAQVSMWPVTAVAVIARTVVRSDVRLVLSDHTLLSMQYAGVGQKRALRATGRLFYPQAEAVVAVSQAVARDLADLTGIGEEAIHVIYNPVPKPPAGASDRQAAEETWGDASRRVLAVGRLKAEKNYPLLLRAFASFRRDKPGSRLVILGDGPLERDIRAEVARLGLEEHVAMPGYATDLGSFYATADLFVLSSDFEGFGNVLVEALQWGLPIVSTDCPGGPREILDGGRYGLLVPPGDDQALAHGMSRALAMPVDKEALRRRACDLSGEQAVHLYAELLGARV